MRMTTILVIVSFATPALADCRSNSAPTQPISLASDSTKKGQPRERLLRVAEDHDCTTAISLANQSETPLPVLPKEGS